MEKLAKQVIEKGFKTSNFSTYNYAFEKGFVTELECFKGEKYVTDDFDYFTFNLTEQERNGLLYRMPVVTDRFKDLKKVIEVELQNKPKVSECRLFVDKDKPNAIIFKLKTFDLVEKLKDYLEDDFDLVEEE